MDWDKILVRLGLGDYEVARLTTHVLDTAHGSPGAGIAVRLFAEGAGGTSDKLLAETRTNKDGRCDAPLLADGQMRSGRFILEFETGAYFRGKGIVLAEPAFLDRVRIYFGMSEPLTDYHVPLLISPYGYTTYRGS
jgi:5-hydroxyisourate hydrolase